jgi:flagellar protein FlaJ
VYSIITGLGGVIVGGFAVAVLVGLGLAGDITSPISFGAIGRTVAAYEGTAKIVVGAVFGGVALGYGTWQVLLRQPASKAAGRKRAINVTLPHAIVFLYALTYGGDERYRGDASTGQR